MKTKVLAIGTLVIGLLAGGSAQAFAAFHTFLFVPGIPGESTDAQHPNWIEVLSMSQGVSSTKRSVACSDLSIMKQLDQAGPAFWAAAAAGQVFPEIHLEVVKVAGDTSAVVYDIKIINARVTSTQTSGSSELPIESVSFSYQSLTLTFNPPNGTGGTTPGTPQTISCQ